MKRRKVQFLKGDGHPMVTKKIGRNAACGCGSGKKAKQCCGTETKYYSTAPKLIEPTPEQERVMSPDVEAIIESINNANYERAKGRIRKRKKIVTANSTESEQKESTFADSIAEKANLLITATK